MRFKSIPVLMTLFLLAIVADVMRADNSHVSNDWPQWRGPKRDGVVTGFSIPKVWPGTLEKNWSVKVGGGYSSPVVSGGLVYQMGRDGDEEHVRCLNLETGKIIWHAKYSADGEVHNAASAHGIGPKSTPTVAHGKLYTLGIGSILSCFDAESGRLVWRKSFVGDFPKSAPSCGTSMSPLIEGNLCIVHVGLDRRGAMYAFDADSGEQLWENDKDGPGYGSPIIATLAGRKQVVAPVSKFIVGIDIDSGEEMWREPFPTFSTQNIVTPVWYRDTIITGGIGQPIVALRIGIGDSGVVQTWQNEDVPLHMSSPVLIGDKLLGLSHKKAGNLFCLEANTGKVLWRGDGRFAKNAAMLSIGDLLAILTSEGDLVFVKPTRSGFKRLAQYAVAKNEKTWAHPVLLDKRVLVKGDEDLVCWSFP